MGGRAKTLRGNGLIFVPCDFAFEITPSTGKGSRAMDEHTLVLSMKPKFASKLLAGEKTVELQRILPLRIKAGDLLLIYSTAPDTSFVGFCRVTQVLQDSPEALWPKVERSAGVTRAEYCRYFGEASRTVGIEIEQPVRLLKEGSLGKSRGYLNGSSDR